jgi:Leucine-rich repeat (LRR) protein
LHIKGIEILDVSNNSLKELNGLQYASLKQLKILKADHNEISKLDSLEGLEQLKEIDLNNNKIRQFEMCIFQLFHFHFFIFNLIIFQRNSFSNLNPIKCLKIEENGLKNFTNIQKLYKLQHLFASNNRLNDFPDIEKLAELPNLKELELNGNALSKRPGYRTIILKKLPLLLYLDGKVRYTTKDSFYLQK